ncbi:MAG: efflux RND transporter periplasmic adaptor subunit [Sedimentisphaerales bacterium]|nr:efflux RND transporter periplasmic adaptor subunit [Sedimentisphaerales bacterium]
MADSSGQKILKFIATGILLLFSLGVGTLLVGLFGFVIKMAASASGQEIGGDPQLKMISVAAGQAVGIILFVSLLRLFRKQTAKDYLHVIAFALILALGLMISGGLTSLRRPPVKKERGTPSPLVTGTKVSVENRRMIVHGFGTVQPKVEVNVVPQVAGKVVSCHPNFVNGGFFQAYESLIIIDQRDYQLAVENAKSAVAAAEVNLAREQAEAAVAKLEWKQLHPETEPTSPLVLREPQIKQTRAQLQAAEAQLAKALLDLERTQISLPFNGRVSRKVVDLGQYITPGQSIATVYSTDVAEIIVPLEDRKLEWFDVPLTKNDGNPISKVEGSPAVLTIDFAGQEYLWQGKVVRTQGRIEESARTVGLVVEVEAPFETTDGRPPLTPGMFVKDVAIQGKELNNIVKIPRYATRKGNQVWVARESKLEICTVRIARQDEQFSYISQGLNDGDIVVLSSLDTVTEGMPLRIQLSDDSKAVGDRQND